MLDIKVSRLLIGQFLDVAEWFRAPPGGTGATLYLLACARGCRVSVPAGLIALWVPIGDAVGIDVAGQMAVVRDGQAYSADRDFAHVASVAGNGAALAVVARPADWIACAALGGAEGLACAPFPALQRLTAAGGAVALQLVRACATPAASALEPASLALRIAELLREFQADFDAPIARCPGATLARRRQIFLRLQRVRHLISCDPTRDLHVAMLAGVASYSPNQLIKLFNRVFGETPYFSLVRQRIEHAIHLLQESRMDIAQVARASGFENRTSFARAFKIHAGATASSLRSSARRHAIQNLPSEVAAGN